MDPAIGPISLDPARLKQVVVNLLDNAIKYTPERGSVIATVNSKDSRAVLEVADSGLGISANDLPHIFDRFWRADKARSREHGGAGLGLSIAKWIAETQAGSITVESKLGKGSVFSLQIPLDQQN